MMTGCIVGTFLGATAATPLPVNVENWPGADKVAIDTLTYARWAFWVTVGIGIPSLFFGVVDYALNLRQFRRPRLSVTTTGGSLIHPWSSDPQGRNYTFSLLLQLKNSGKRGAHGCYVSIWIPNNLKRNTIDIKHWQNRPDPFVSKGERGVSYLRFETFVSEPVFVDHPVVLHCIDFDSAAGATRFRVLWAAYDEHGVSSGELLMAVEAKR